MSIHQTTQTILSASELNKVFHLRLLSAISLISLLLLAVWLDYWYPLLGIPGLWMWPLGFYAAWATASEFTRLAEHGGHRICRRDILLAVSAIYCISSIPLLWPLSGRPYPQDCAVGIAGWPALAVPISFFALAARLMLRYQQDGKSLEELAVGGMIILYVGGCASFWLIIRAQPSPRWALLALVGVIAVTKLADIGAYGTGKLLGKTKLCPKISPGKTIEGLVGGFLLASLGSWLYFNHFMPWLQPVAPSRLGIWGPLVLAILLTVTGLVGDLTESIIKRDVGSKDSGHLIPGMGGIWDVTDSLLPAAVIGFLGIVAGLIPSP